MLNIVVVLYSKSKKWSAVPVLTFLFFFSWSMKGRIWFLSRLLRMQLEQNDHSLSNDLARKVSQKKTRKQKDVGYLAILAIIIMKRKSKENKRKC